MVKITETVVFKPLNQLVPNREQSHHISDDDIIKIANSIDDIGQIEPIIVRPYKKMFEICDGQSQYQALKYLKKTSAPVIIRNYSEDEGCEVALASIFLRSNVPSYIRERNVAKRWKSKKYKTYRELGRKIGRTGERVSNILWADEARQKTNGTLVSTETLLATKKVFTDSERQQFCDLVKGEEIRAKDAREAAKFLRSCSEEQKKSILNGEISCEKAKQVIEQIKPRLKNLSEKIVNEYNKKQVIKKIIKKESYHSPDIIRFLVDFIRELEPTYIDKITDEIEKKQASSDAVIATGLLIRLLHKLSVIDISNYESMLKSLGLKSSYVEMAKEDGHNYLLPTEWKTPFEEEMDEKERLLKTSRKEPLGVI